MGVFAIAGLIVLMTGAEFDVRDRQEDIERAFSELNSDNTEGLSSFYAESVQFEDPLVKIDGLDALKKYYAGLYEPVEEIRFVFDRHISHDNLHVATWTMHLRAKRLNKGKEIAVSGSSVLEFNDAGKVISHRDYFDLGEMVYQHVPFVRFLVRQTNRRLTSDVDPIHLKASSRSKKSDDNY